MQTITKNNSNSSISGKLPDDALEDGIYCNSRASHVAVSLIGCPVHVQVKDGTIYDGILSTISSELTIVLDMAHKCSDGTKANLPLTKETPIIDTIAFSWSDVVTMTALNVDLGYATRDFATDTAISRANGQAKMRDLQPFECDGPLVGGLEDGGRQNGWSADDMFQTNETKFTIQSSFNQDLSQYTTPLPNQNSADYREKSERAARLAMEIEGGDLSRDRMDLENGGDDEEMAFSAVHRNQRPSRNNHHSNTPQSSYRRGGGGGGDRGMGMNGPRTVGRGGPSGRGGSGGPGSGGPSPRQFGSPQQGPGATSPQTPMGPTSPAGGPMSQQPSRPGGGVGRQDSNPENRYHHQQPPQHGRMQSSDYGRQSSAPENWRNHGPPPSAVEPRHAGNRNEARPVTLAGGAGRSPQPTMNEPRRSVGLSLSAEKNRDLGGPADSSKPPPWSVNQQSPSQQQPPRNEPLPPRSQAPPLSSAPRTLSSEQKPLPVKGPKETQRIADLQEFSEQFKIQYETSQAARDSKSSPRPVQPQSGPSPHPSPLRLEQGGGVGGGHDLQPHPHQGLKTSSSEPLIVKSPADVQLLHTSPAPATMTKAPEDARASGDKVMHAAADGEVGVDAEKKKLMVKVSTLNPNAKEFNPGKVFQPKPVTSPTPSRVAPPTMAPPTPAAAAPQPAAPAQILVQAGPTYIPMQSYPMPVMMTGVGAGQMVRPVQQPAATKRATVSVANGRLDQAQAATGQPLVATPPTGYNLIPLQQVRLLDPSQMAAQQQQIIVNQQMAQHMAGQQQHQAQQRPMAPNQGGHASSSPVHQPPMHAPQTPTSNTPQAPPPSQVYYSQQQQQHGQMMGTPTSPQQAYPPQPHYTAALQQQLGHVTLPTGYQYGPGVAAAQQYQQHTGGAPAGTTPHGVVQMGGSGPGGYMQHPHMGQQPHVIVQQPPQQAPGQPHPASQMQPMVGQGHPGIPGGVSSQPAGLGPQYVGNVYYQVPYIAAQPGTAYHPAGGHMIPSSMQTFQSTQ